MEEKKNLFFEWLALFPYGFCALYMDAIWGHFWGYILAGAIILSTIRQARTGKGFLWTLSLSLVSGLMSYILSTIFLGPDWNYYFKPFEARVLALLITGLSLLCQLTMYSLRKRKGQYR